MSELLPGGSGRGEERNGWDVQRMVVGKSADIGRVDSVVPALLGRSVSAGEHCKVMNF